MQTADDFWKKKRILKGEAPSRPIMVQEIAPHPGVYGQPKLDTMGHLFKKRGHEIGDLQTCGWILEELGGETLVNMIKIDCMKLSKNNKNTFKIKKVQS